MRSRVLPGALGALLVLAVACSGGAETSDAQTAKLLPVDDGSFLASYPRYEDEAAGLRIVLGTPDLGVGRHRVGFVLSDANGLIRLPVVQVVSYFYPAGAEGQREGPVEVGLGRFFEFPYGVRGMFSLELEFDRAGTWGLEVLVPRPDGATLQTSFAFPVAERTLAPAVGDPAPHSESRTAADVASLNELTTGNEPDAALYRVSLAEAVEEGRPLVVVFASPAFCTNALCGPQVEVLSELASRYGERANFIHIDLYENPHEIKGDLDRAVRTPILEQWGIETDEWTFVVDGAGVITARFEAFVTRVELEEALLRVLEGDSAARRSQQRTVQSR